MVQTFFPGRIVALEPTAEEAEGEAAEGAAAEGAAVAVRPDDAADGGPDDGASRPSG